MGVGRPRIVALGDSLTSGHGIGTSLAFPAELQRLIDRAGFDYEVVNAGVSRDTSADGLRRFRDTLKGDVRVLIIALGANDGLRHVPVEQLRANLSRIIEHARSQRIAVLLCAMETLPIYGWDYAAAFHRVYQELAATCQVPLAPFMLSNVVGNPAFMQPDRMHPNAHGARRMADNIWPYLQPLLRRIAPASSLG